MKPLQAVPPHLDALLISSITIYTLRVALGRHPFFHYSLNASSNMLGRSAGVIASCALGASAFLLPPSTALEQDDSSSVFPLFALDAKSMLFTFPCPSCDWAYASKDVALGATQNQLVVNFTIAKDNSGLLAGDSFIYPQTKRETESSSSMSEMWLDQTPISTTQDQIHSNDYPKVPLKVDWAGVFEAVPVTTPGHTLISLQWKIHNLNKTPMTDIPMLAIQLLKADDGELLLLSVDIEAGEPTVKKLPDWDAASFRRPHRRPCGLPRPFCSLNRLVESVFGSNHPRPCSGGRKFTPGSARLPTHARPTFGRTDPVDGADLSDAASEYHKQHWRSHHGHRHGRHSHSFFHIVSHRILAVLIPIMAGITVGVLVGVLGLAFGRLLGYLWFTAFRGGRRGYASVATEEGYPADLKQDAEVKYVQPPPVYVDAPPHEEVTEGQQSRN